MRGIAKAACILVGSALIAQGACDVGVYGAVDGGGGGGGGGGDVAPDCLQGSATPVPFHPHADDGTGHTGRACVVAGCHLDASVSGLLMTFGGTIYASPSATPPAGGLAGAAITVGPQTVYADTEGNFYSGVPITFPIMAASATCPTTVQMTDPLTATGGLAGSTGGDCNSCHVSPAGALPQTGIMYQ